MSIYRDGYEHGKLLYAERPYIDTLAVMDEALVMASRLNLPIEQQANYRDGVFAGYDCEKKRVELATMQKKLRGREHEESPKDMIRKIRILRAQIYVYEQGDVKDREKEKEYE